MPPSLPYYSLGVLEMIIIRCLYITFVAGLWQMRVLLDYRTYGPISCQTSTERMK